MTNTFENESAEINEVAERVKAEVWQRADAIVEKFDQQISEQLGLVGSLKAKAIEMMQMQRERGAYLEVEEYTKLFGDKYFYYGHNPQLTVGGSGLELEAQIPQGELQYAIGNIYLMSYNPEYEDHVSIGLSTETTRQQFWIRRYNSAERSIRIEQVYSEPGKPQRSSEIFVFERDAPLKIRVDVEPYKYAEKETAVAFYGDIKPNGKVEIETLRWHGQPKKKDIMTIYPAWDVDIKGDKARWKGWGPWGVKVGMTSDGNERFIEIKRGKELLATFPTEANILDYIPDKPIQDVEIGDFPQLPE